MDFGTCFKLWVLNDSWKKNNLKVVVTKSIKLFVSVSFIFFILIIHVKKIEFTLNMSPQETPTVIP